jgi:hypothetical protein
VEKLDERDFDEQIRGDVTIRTHAMDLEDWLPTTNFGILNTAFLPDGHALVMASSPERLEAALDADGEERSQSSAAAIAAADITVHSALIEFGPDACLDYDPRTDEGSHPGNAALLENVLPLRAWEMLAVVTGRDGADAPAGQLFFSFADADAAAGVADTIVSIALSPVDGHHRNLQNVVLSRDPLPAMSGA